MNVLFEGWKVMAIAFGVFALLYVLNIIFGAIENCVIGEQRFEWAKIRNSFLRIFMAGVLSFAILVGFNALALIPEGFGANISELAKSGISIAAFVLLYAKGFYKLAIDVYEKIRGWFEMPDKTKFDAAALENIAVQTTVNRDDVRGAVVENEF